MFSNGVPSTVLSAVPRTYPPPGAGRADTAHDLRLDLARGLAKQDHDRIHVALEGNAASETALHVGEVSHVALGRGKQRAHDVHAGLDQDPP